MILYSMQLQAKSSITLISLKYNDLYILVLENVNSYALFSLKFHAVSQDKHSLGTESTSGTKSKLT